MKQKLLALLFYILPHHAISWLMFKLARIRWTPLKNLIIRIYTRLNPVNMHEAVEEDMFAYESLNAFFTRALKPECRPFDDDEKNWLCPVDGSVSQAQQIRDGRIFQAKGQEYSLLELVGGDKDLETTFGMGSSPHYTCHPGTTTAYTCRRRVNSSICDTFPAACSA